MHAVRRVSLFVLAFLLMLAGAAFLLAPFVGEAVFRHDASGDIAKVESMRELVLSADGESASNSSPSLDAGVDSRSLLEEREWLESYNRQVAAGERVLAQDSFDFGETAEWSSSEMVADGLVGSIDIPSMDCSLPLYLGSGYDHMAKGATVVEGSSAPLGGESTNCVIAAHRGWNQTAMFRDIERLSVGDSVSVHTVWQDLRYTVVGIRVIAPTDTQEVRVRQGLDLVTLVTCHPYGYNYQRYAVFCMRNDSDVAAGIEDGDNADIFSNDMATTKGEGRMLEAVLGNPIFEDVLRVLGVALLVSSLCVATSRLWGRR